MSSAANVIDGLRESAARVCEEVATVVFGGGTVIFPTDTVYGIGCDPHDVLAVDRVFALKERPRSKPLSLHLASTAEFLEYAKDNRVARLAAAKLLPGPVTLIVERPAFIRPEVTCGFPSLGFRVPDDPLCRAILERCGPLAATSANLSGEPAYEGEGGEDALPPADLLVKAGPTRYRMESSILDLTGPEPLLLREGVLPFARIAELLQPVTLLRQQPVRTR